MAEPLRHKYEEDKIETASLDVSPSPPALPPTPPAELHEGPFVVGGSVEDVKNRGIADRVSETVSDAMETIQSQARSGVRTVAEKSREAGDALGDAAESAQERARELSREAQIRMDEFRRAAYRRMRQARTAARRAADEHPLETILAIGGFALVVGFLLRVWRSNSD